MRWYGTKLLDTAAVTIKRRWSITAAICFGSCSYDRRRFAALSNFANTRLVLGELEARTAEGLYQALKFEDPEIRQRIAAASPSDAKRLAHTHQDEIRPGWIDRHQNIAAMALVLETKWRQSDRFRTALAASGNAPIIEVSRNDSFWGAVPAGPETAIGSNVLGQLLAATRDRDRPTEHDHDVAQRTGSRIYAGIGARDTNEPTRRWIEQAAAALARAGWTLRSGAAEGADSAWERGARTAGGNVEIYLPWDGYNGRSPDGESTFAAPESEERTAFAATHHPAWRRLAPGPRALFTRNVAELRGADNRTPLAGLVIAATPNGKPVGGTGHTLRMADTLGIPAINLGLALSRYETAANIPREVLHILRTTRETSRNMPVAAAAAEKRQATIVANKRDIEPLPGDVYIGRPSRWGNPFKVAAEDERAEAIERYRDRLAEDLEQNSTTAADLRTLAGRRLVCWCAPKPCHGDVLASAADLARKGLPAPEIAEALRNERGRTTPAPATEKKPPRRSILQR